MMCYFSGFEQKHSGVLVKPPHPFLTLSVDAEHTKRKNRAKLAREMEFWSDLMRSGAAKRKNDAFLTGETAGADMANAEMRQATGTGWEVGKIQNIEGKDNQVL